MNINVYDRQVFSQSIGFLESIGFSKFAQKKFIVHRFLQDECIFFKEVDQTGIYYPGFFIKTPFFCDHLVYFTRPFLIITYRRKDFTLRYFNLGSKVFAIPNDLISKVSTKDKIITFKKKFYLYTTGREEVYTQKLPYIKEIKAPKWTR